VAASVAISGDRVARVGRFEATASRVIDATGCYVAPGFIDMMDQSGAPLGADGRAESKVRQGVTTGIAGEGGTPVPAEQLDAYSSTPTRPAEPAWRPASRRGRPRGDRPSATSA